MSAVVSLLALAACSSSSSGSKSTSSTKFTGPSITVGNSTPIDTALGNYPGAKAASIAAVAHINATGGIKTADGKTHELKLLFCNNQNTPNGSVTCAQRFISEHVAAVVGNVDINSAHSAPILTKAAIPNLGDSLLTAWDYAGSNSYPVEGSAVIDLAGLALELAHRGIKTVRLAALSETQAATGPLVSSFQAAYSQAGGKMLSPTFFPQATTDYSPIAAQVVEGHPQAVVILTGTQFVGPLAQAIVKLGGTTPQFGDVAGVITPAVLKATGNTFDNAILVSQFSSTDSPEWATFTKAMHKYQPDADPSTVFGFSAPNAQNAWVAVTAFQNVASKLSGSITSAKVKAALNTTTDLSLGELGATVNFTKPFKCGPFARTFNTTYYGPLQVKNGDIVPGAGAAYKNDAAPAVIAGVGAGCKATAAQLGVS